MIVSWRDFVRYPSGAPASGVSVSVRNLDGSLATIYENRLGAVAQNPVRTNSFGEIHIFAEPGEYYLDVSGSYYGITLEETPDTVNPGAVGVLYSQSEPSAQWVIPFSREGRPPVVSVYVGGEEVLADVAVHEDGISITFASPTVGDAVIV